MAKIENIIEQDLTIEPISEVEVVEEYLDIDESLIEYEKDNELVRMDMNIIEYPIFSKAKIRKVNQGKKYFFKSDGSSYLEVSPVINNHIPGEFEERIFIAITKIMRNNNYEKSFYVTASEILKNLKINEITSLYRKKLKKAMDTIAKTSYTFVNSLYSNELKGIVEDKITTNIMNIRTITRKDDISKEIEYFEDGRVKEIYRIELSDYFYNNIIKKGYLAFDSDKLLEMENATTRSIFTMIEKWRGYELYLKRPAFHIARRIPLSWDKTHISRTLSRIEKSCDELEAKGLIKGYNKVKNGKNSKTEFEFFFDEEHNKLKRSNFFIDRNTFSDIMITHTENTKEKIELNEELNRKIEKIINVLPYKAKSLKTLPEYIQKSLEKYDFDYLLGTAEYVYKNNPKKSLKGYFVKAVEENWADEYIASKKTKKGIVEVKKIEEAIIVPDEKNAKERTADERKKLDNYFNNLPKDEKEKLTLTIQGKIIKNNGQLIPKVLEVMTRNSIERYDILEVEMNKNYSKEKSNIYLNEVEEKFENITSFSMRLLKILKELEINSYTEVLEILKTFEEFNDVVDGYRIELKYIHSEYSYIKISK